MSSSSSSYEAASPSYSQDDVEPSVSDSDSPMSESVGSEDLADEMDLDFPIERIRPLAIEFLAAAREHWPYKKSEGKDLVKELLQMLEEVPLEGQ